MSDVLTLRIDIHDKEKVRWLWEGAKGEPGFIAQYGFTVGMMAWGDPYNEKDYVLDKIYSYLNRSDRTELLEQMGLEYDAHDEAGQLDELIGIWEEEARELYGADVTHEQRQARFKADKEAKAAAKAQGELDV